MVLISGTPHRSKSPLPNGEIDLDYVVISVCMAFPSPGIVVPFSFGASNADYEMPASIFSWQRAQLKSNAFTMLCQSARYTYTFDRKA